MAVLLSTKAQAMAAWRAALLALDPSLDIRLFPDPDDPNAIGAAVVWTAHAASITIPSSAAPQVVENLHRARQGKPLINLVDFAAGY